MLTTAYGEVHAFRWYKTGNVGRKAVEDEMHSRQRSTSVPEEYYRYEGYSGS